MTRERAIAMLLNFDVSLGADPAALAILSLTLRFSSLTLRFDFCMSCIYCKLYINVVIVGSVSRIGIINDVQAYVTELHAQPRKELQDAGNFFVGLVVAF